MSRNKLLLTLVLFGLVSVAFANLPLRPAMSITGEVTEQPSAFDTVRMGTTAAVTTRDVAVGQYFKGPLDDTVRTFTVQSATPRRVLLFTDTTTVAPTKMYGWRSDMVDSAGTGYTAAAVGDANGDGYTDMFYAHAGTPFWMRRAQWNPGTSKWDTTMICVHAAAINDIAVGDADNDGDLEVVYGAGLGLFTLDWNAGTSTWDTTRIASPLGTIYGVAIGDFDASLPGNEIAVATYYGSFEVVAYTGGVWVTTPILAATAIGFYDVAIGDFIPENPGNEVALNNGYNYATYGNVFFMWGSGTLWDYVNFASYTAWTSGGEVTIGNIMDYRPYRQAIFTVPSTTQPPIAFYKDNTGDPKTGWWVRTLIGTGGTSYGVATGNIDKWRSTTPATEEMVFASNSRLFLQKQRLQLNNDVTLSAIRFLTAPIIVGDSVTVRIKITNTGYTTQNTVIPVYYYHPTLGLITENCNANIAYMDSVLYDFSQKIYRGDTVTTAVKCSLALTGDEYVADDFGTANVKAYFTLSGTKYVGTVDADYPTLTAALAAWKARIITGNVKFELTDATYGSETYPLTCTIPAGYSGGDWNLTIKPTSGLYSSFTGGNATALMRLYGVNRCTVDSISFENTISGPVLLLIGGASYNTIQNCVIKGVGTGTTSADIYISTAGATGNSYNTIQNNTITRGTAANMYCGIYSLGTSGKMNKYNVIANNKIYDFSYYGIYLYSYDSLTTIRDNDIYTSTQQTNSTIIGIDLHATTTHGAQIYRNYIHDFWTTSTAPTFTGIYLYYGSTTVMTNVYNNFISLDAVNTHVGGTIYGIREGSGTGYLFNIYNNSIYIGGTAVTSGSSYGISKSLAAIMDIKNNIIFNNRANGTGIGKHYCMYMSNVATLTSNYNDLYAPNDSGYVGYWATGSVYAKTLAAWQAASLLDANSISANPDFGSLSDVVDLHIQSTSQTVNRKATPLALVTNDYDQQARNGLFPDIGADEYTPDMPGAPTLTYPTSNQTNTPLFGNLTWTAGSMNSFFDVFLDVVNPPVTKVGSLLTGTSLAYSGLPTGTMHYWQVVAWNDTTGVGDAQSVASGVDSFMTAVPPNAPTALLLTNITNGSMDLGWTDNSWDEDSFFVYKSTNGTSFDKVASLDANVVTYSDATLSVNTRYWWRVTAYHNTNGESNFAGNNDWTLANVPGVPTFSDVAEYAMKVYIDLNGNPTTTEFVVRVNYTGTDVTKYVDPTTGTLADVEVWGTYTAFGGASGKLVTGLLSNTVYTFDVKARNGALVATAYGTSAAQTTLPFRDVGVTAITVPPTGTIGAAQITPQVTVTNNGQQTEDITAIAQILQPSMFEGFEGTTFPPAGWDTTTVVGTTTYGWSRVTSGTYPTCTPHTGAAMAKFYSFLAPQGAQKRLITPFISIGAGQNLSFWMTLSNGYPTDQDSLFIDVTTNGTTWTAIDSFTRVGANASEWVQKIVSLAGYVGSSIRIAFRGYSSYGYNIYLDDVSIQDLIYYADTTVVTGVLGASDATAEAYFDAWTPPASGTYIFKAYTVLAEDLNPANNEMIRSFTVDMTPPAVPTLIEPANATTVGADPIFVWNAIGDATEYNLVVDDGVAETDININTTDTTYEHGMSLDGGTGYTWTVRAKDAYDNYSGFAPANAFEVDATAPAVPTPIAPAESTVLVTETQTFEWGYDEDVAEYELVIEPYEEPIPSTDVSYFTGDTSYTVSLASGVYTYKVRGRDQYNNWSDYSTPVYFVVELPAWTLLPTEVPQAGDIKSGKRVKDGGSMVAVGNDFYLFPGNKSWQFYKYSPNAVEPDPMWTTLESIPYGVKYKYGIGPDPLKINKKKIGKGAALCYDGENTIYAIKGNGTYEFWAFDMTTTVETIPHPNPESVQIIITGPHWEPRAFLPSIKGAKGGSSLLYKGGLVYALIGGLKPADLNFFVYDPTGDTALGTPWTALPAAPAGINGKAWKDGSALAAIGDVIYAIKGKDKYNPMWAYNGVDWTEVESIPLAYPTSMIAKPKKNKVGDGACVTTNGSVLYVAKGAGKQDFWMYTPAYDTLPGMWTPLDTINKFTIGAETNGKKSVPKTGAAMAYANGYVWLMKGNNRPEICRYNVLSEGNMVTRSAITTTSVMVEKTTTASLFNLMVSPNPFTRLATVKYSVPVTGKVSVKLYNATGRLTETLLEGTMNAGAYTMNLNATTLAKGVYFLRFTNETNSSEVKLIVQ